MNLKSLILISLLLQYVTVFSQSSKFSFDTAALNTLPDDWEIASTSLEGEPSTWKVMEDKTAPSENHVLALTNTNHNSKSTFNICYNKNIDVLNGEIEVKFKAVSGRVDQGGGLIWRYLDDNNYYIARFNPLENNFRVYHVKNGIRTTIGDTRIKLRANQWHTMKITFNGDSIKASLNGMELINIKDNTFSKSGKIGLWTKADAVTSFDDLLITVLK